MKRLGLAIVCSLAMGEADADLIDRGGGLIFDTRLNITWLANANLGAGSSFDDGPGDGRMTARAALAWADDLVYGGFSDWRLPTAQLAGDVPELYFQFEINFDCVVFPDRCISYHEVELFTNVQPWWYWTGAEEFGRPVAYDFRSPNEASWDEEYAYFYAWAVRDGDVATSVPEPGTLSLLGVSLAALYGLGRKRRRSMREMTSA